MHSFTSRIRSAAPVLDHFAVGDAHDLDRLPFDGGVVGSNTLPVEPRSCAVAVSEDVPDRDVELLVLAPCSVDHMNKARMAEHCVAEDALMVEVAVGHEGFHRIQAASV